MKQISLLLVIIFLIVSSRLSAQDVLKLKSGTELKVKVQEITPQEVKYKRFDNLNGPIITILKSTAQSIKYENGTIEQLSDDATQITTSLVAAASVRKGLDVGDIVSIDYYSQKYEGEISEINKRRDTAVVKFNNKGRLETVNRPIGQLMLIRSKPQEPISPPVATNQAYFSAQQPIAPAPVVSQDYTNMYQQGEVDAKRYYRGYKGAGTGTFLTTFLISPIIGLIPAIACSSTAPNRSNLGFPNSQLAQNNDYYQGYSQEAKHIKSKKVWGNFGIGTGILLGLLVIASAAR